MEISVADNMADAIENAIPEALMAAMQKACLIVEADAKKKCPVDDGTLRNSITHDTESEKDSVTGVIGTNTEYAP